MTLTVWTYRQKSDWYLVGEFDLGQFNESAFDTTASGYITVWTFRARSG
jgi:hypothetical protein